jgi:uncharacterized membrane protein YbhN (UPF0104 family)
MVPLFYIVLPVIVGGLGFLYVKKRRARKASAQ